MMILRRRSPPNLIFTALGLIIIVLGFFAIVLGLAGPYIVTWISGIPYIGSYITPQINFISILEDGGIMFVIGLVLMVLGSRL